MEVQTQTIFYILDEQNQKFFAQRRSFHYQTTGTAGVMCFVKRSELENNLLPDDCLTIGCELTAARDAVNLTNQSNDSTCLRECQKLLGVLNNQKLLLNDPDFYDIKLAVSGKEYYAHKAFLAAQSPVFLAMLKNDTIEKRHNRVELVDIDGEILEELLLFVYSGKVKSMETNVYGLLAAADKYAIEGLKAMCEEHLCQNLSLDNVVTSISLADRQNAAMLKKHAIDFLVTHKNEFANSDEYKTIENLEANILKEILQIFMLK